MNRVRAFFVEEATECLEALATELSGPRPDPAAVHAAVRRFRGSAQLARFGRLAEEAWSLEAVLKPASLGTGPLEEGLRRAVETSVASLARGVNAVRDGRMEQDEREPVMDETEQHGDETEAVDIGTLEYRGAKALAAARALREPLEQAIVDGAPPGGILDELFDLIELSTK